MGLLSQGRPLDWDETKKYAKYVQERGIAQFINIYHKSKDRADAPFKWGDEVEYIIVRFDHQNRKTRVSLKADQVFQRIAEQNKNHMGPLKSCWNPEFASYMVEGTPGLPYGGDGLMLSSLCEIEESMRYRRDEVQDNLDANETVMSITSYPRLGCHDFTHPSARPQPEASASGSLFFPDEAIYGGHPRFKTLVKNIRSRRRRKVIINLPIFRDIHTPNPFMEYFPQCDHESRKALKPNHVYMDAMGFGMGCCCLQITMQATHLEEAKVLYDQLAPLTPIALALSAASPIYRGYLTDRDCRWDVISCSVDDRTKEESSETRELKDSRFRLPKSRYDSISCYLSRHGQMYNDLPLVYDQAYYNHMIVNMVDPAVARHIAHLFVRDPITLYKEKLEQSDQELDHFENIQSTNWQTMRFKPPPAVDSPIGWRVEFRPFEAQTTDFENAAFVVFITLLSRVILAYKLNFLMPLSLVDENMTEAQKRDAVRDSKFWFRSDITHRSSAKGPLSTVLENCSGSGTSSLCSATTNTLTNNGTSADNNINNRLRSRIGGGNRVNNNSNSSNNNNNNNLVADSKGQAAEAQCCKQMTANEIINGCDDFVGIMPIVWHYVESLDDGSNTELIMKIKRYLRLVSERASLEVKTTARWMRDFVATHPSYKHDSVVSDEVAYDLLHTMDKLGKSQLLIPELIGDSRPADNSTRFNCCAKRTTTTASTMSIKNGRNSSASVQQYGSSSSGGGSKDGISINPDSPCHGHNHTSHCHGHNHSHSHGHGQAIVRKSTTLCSGLRLLARKSPPCRGLRVPGATERHLDHQHNNRSISR